MARVSRKAQLIDAVARQQEWIAGRGGNEAGYVEYYGSATDEGRYGDGGELIWAADKAALDRLEAELARAR